MAEENVYERRDQLLGEIHGEVKGMKEWRKEHEEKDDRRFLWTCVAILAVAMVTGALPQLTAFALEHIKY